MDTPEKIWEEMIDGTAQCMLRRMVRHNQVAGHISSIFHNYLSQKEDIPFGFGSDLNLSPKDRFMPDVMVVCNRDKVRWDGVYGAPDLVVEVLSPDTVRNDRGYKKDAYEAHGVPEYWIVSPDNRSVEVYRLQEGRYRLDNVYQLYPDYIRKAMEQEGRDTAVTEFKCRLYDDLTFSLEDIFSNLIVG